MVVMDWILNSLGIYSYTFDFDTFMNDTFQSFSEMTIETILTLLEKILILKVYEYLDAHSLCSR